jgi:hypothetical protein
MPTAGGEIDQDGPQRGKSTPEKKKASQSEAEKVVCLLDSTRKIVAQ